MKYLVFIIVITIMFVILIIHIIIYTLWNFKPLPINTIKDAFFEMKYLWIHDHFPHYIDYPNGRDMWIGYLIEGPFYD